MEYQDCTAPVSEAVNDYNVAGIGPDELRLLLHDVGEPAYRALQVFEGIYKHRWTDWEQFTNLPKLLRARLDSVHNSQCTTRNCVIKWPEIVRTLVSSDNSAKHLLRLADGNEVECVYMPYEDRATLCVSSQVGCGMGCTFCATGAMGFTRNLTAAEIVGQVMSLIIHHEHPLGFPINVVFMGMGEPLHNLKQVMGAFSILTHAKGLALSQKRVTLSTAGLAISIRQLGEYWPRPRLALSLNATTDATRSKIMPVNSSWGMDELSDVLRTFPLAQGERITIEFVMFKGVSDSMDDARRLSKFADQFPSKINLIPYNPCPSLKHQFCPPDERRLDEFGAYLAKRGHIVGIRRSRGSDIGGACGQLVGQSAK